jgi:pyruvate,orthophosphate dikinase
MAGNSAKWVYTFGAGKAEGAASMKNLLGGKGANLAEMSSLGLPVPPGFTIPTEVCNVFYELGKKYPAGLHEQVGAALAQVESIVGKNFGDPANPLLVSVRSGARASMPGMMDTVLNLGLNDETVKGMAALAGERFAADSYRRFITMYSSVVLGIGHHHFEDALTTYKTDHDLELDTELGAEDWTALVETYKAIVKKRLGKEFPQDPQEQLWGAIGAVFDSWMNDRAKVYRRLHDIPESWGTAVNVQAMVFGNMGDTSATGVAFTRDPNTGAKAFFGEYLINAQGEDVVAGIRTPGPITIAAKTSQGNAGLALEETMPDVYAQLVDVYKRLEGHYRDMQDIEFTVETGKLWMLQTRNGKRSTRAALKIAVDMVAEGMIDKNEAVQRIDPASLDQLLHPTITSKTARSVLTKGLAASPGAAVGKVVFDSGEAERLSLSGEDVILVRDETSPEDIHGMYAARGIVTARGGLTSHAAVVARGMGRPCVCGAVDIRLGEEEFSVKGVTVKAGDVITIDGSSGEVILGKVEMVQPELSGDFAQLMEWADSIRRLKVRANAETPRDAEAARKFGAEGIGLCRTEHMFFEADRIAAVREMILSNDKAGRVAALNKILPMQRKDFADLFRIMAGLPVTIRFLDPPLHEFLPHTHEDVIEVARATGLDPDALLQRAKDLHEMNPMLGHRGCRLGITFPEIYEMQARAVFEAALAVAQETGATVVPEIMIPLVATKKELEILKGRVDAVAQDVFKERGANVEYVVGTMIELPRAALRADEIAEAAQFFSFGTNDLTQTTIGISRDDAGKFLNAYVEAGIFEKDPFISLDTAGVGDLIGIAVERGRKTRPGLKLGICGEHGGDPASIAFCESLGLDYVSCSPFRAPIARLAAAQATLQSKIDGLH